MSKINQNNQQSSIRSSVNLEKNSSDILDVSISGSADYDEKGYFFRESRLLINEGQELIKTENGDNFLLEISNRDTIQVESSITGRA